MKNLMLEGQAAGAPQHGKMGAYELMEGKLVSGRCVWRRVGGGHEAYLFYAASSGKWHVGSKTSMEASMEAGKSRGRLHVESDALTPDKVTETWKVYAGGDGNWQARQQLKARV